MYVGVPSSKSKRCIVLKRSCRAAPVDLLVVYTKEIIGGPRFGKKTRGKTPDLNCTLVAQK